MPLRTIVLLIFISCFYAVLQGQSRYYKTETHCHSSNSGDGFIAPAALLSQYNSRGYDIVFLSDHDTLTDAESLNVPGILAINAEELSCGSHFNGFNMNSTVQACGMSNQQKVDAILSQDALVCINHPVAPRWRITAEEILNLQGKIDFVEIYNPTDIYEAADDQSLWDSLLTAGWKIWGIASGDVHQFYPLEDLWLGWSMVRAEMLTKEAVLDAMLRGDFYASTGVEISENSVSGDTVRVACTNCRTIIFWGENHTRLKVANRQSLEYVRRPGDKYVRAELIFDRYNKAWTQPVFFDVATTISPSKNEMTADVFPNPAKDQTAVYYSLRQAMQLHIALYDVQGKLVRTFSDGFQTSGRHGLMMDISGLPAGTYLLKLSGEKSGATRLVIVL